ncbi:MAG: NAD(P)H-dependent oxidoreductase [Arcobacter sp.]|jgi:NAD(P)H-dependent FMN reductase|uniref:NADPH-dependent FMN reductase n=1 Tax=unclassified Arcobacter TaxID=2593671 RepID=UPI0002296524|nr:MULTISPECIES: NAD(P)H-dependent oxidoreductase [unclassified Arcobacter]MDY3200281.1 NAD(P)H-dependent oxidoreductase [Arcobacter sp.]BAK72069.1 putative reductase [Arcobacter sp. L]
MVLIFVASLNENMNLANMIKDKFENKNINSKIINLVDLNLPMYDTFKEQNDGIPKVALDLAKQMEEATAYVFVSPEYNYGVPPVLVNMIAWISRIGDNFRALFSMKKIQLATHSGSNGQDLLNDLRSQFTRLGAIVMPREIITTYERKCQEDSLERILEQFETLIKE